MVVLTDPWPHMVIDDYYDADVFAEITKHAKRYLRDRVDISTRKQAFPYPESPELREAIDTRPLDESFLQHFPTHRPYDQLTLFWEVNYLRGPYVYPVHDETPRKVLSSVVYIGPKVNEGTRLYDANKQYVKTVEWRPNRALIFAAIDGVTWHDYTAPADSVRLTINQFLDRGRENLEPVSEIHRT